MSTLFSMLKKNWKYAEKRQKNYIWARKMHVLKHSQSTLSEIIRKKTRKTTINKYTLVDKTPSAKWLFNLAEEGGMRMAA